LLTALSPHLVAIDHFILTESLFTFTLVVAVLVFVISWQRRKLSLSVFAGLLFGFSILIRPIALLIVPFMVVCYFIQGRNIGFASKTALLTQVFCLVVGCAAIYSPYLAYRNQSSQEGFSVSNQSISQKIVLGADINLRNFIKAKTDPELRSEIARMTRDKMYTLKVFKERFLNDPFSYLKWYIGGKVVFMWHWDSTYIGDVYQYPMIKKGFHTHALLHAVHTLMRFLHWPLYVFAILSPIFLFGIRRLLRSHSKTVFLIPSFFIFLYFAALLTLLIPLPRYAIPIRPFIYILGVFVIAQILQTTCYVFKMKSSGLTNKVLLMNS